MHVLDPDILILPDLLPGPHHPGPGGEGGGPAWGDSHHTHPSHRWTPIARGDWLQVAGCLSGWAVCCYVMATYFQDVCIITGCIMADCIPTGCIMTDCILTDCIDADCSPNCCIMTDFIFAWCVVVCCIETECIIAGCIVAGCIVTGCIVA